LSSALLWAPRAWLPGGWADAVLLRVGSDGRWAEVEAGVAAPPEAQQLQAAVLPGLVDAHSHAFQRAFAGLAERSERSETSDSDIDDFWSWRERMYAVAGRITPGQLQAVAAQLFVELLRGGYTQVCEFHYLHHAGLPGTEPALAPAWAMADAAAQAGIGLTLMPALYERAGFGQAALRPQQARFASGAAQTWAAAQAIASSGRPLLNAGLAFHSLRAATPDSIHALRRLAEGWVGPIHIHVAEQTAEVADCLAATGARPIEWLLREGLLDARWQLVHATHATAQEIDAVAGSAAGVVLCPSTEANLGDGLPDLAHWLAAGVPLAIGSDSQVTRDWREELRWLEYGQRLQRRQRNVSAAGLASDVRSSSSAERLWTRALAGGAAAAGQPRWGLAVGARADLLVADPQDEALLGLPASPALDALVFSSPGRPWAQVMVAGRWVLRDHAHAEGAAIASRFALAMQALWEDVPGQRPV
jgi:formimidoylglutamate deiminase